MEIKMEKLKELWKKIEKPFGFAEMISCKTIGKLNTKLLFMG